MGVEIKDWRLFHQTIHCVTVNYTLNGRLKYWIFPSLDFLCPFLKYGFITPSSTQQFGDRKVCWNSCRISLNIPKSMAFMNVVISIVLTYYCRFLKSHSFECSFIKITSSTTPLLLWSACFRPEGERTCIYIQ